VTTRSTAAKSFKTRTASSRVDWETPDHFYKLLDDEFHFTLDPCASDENHKCEKYFTEADDGLQQDWAGEVAFVNPPYDTKAGWMKKCFEEGRKSRTIVVLLTPSYTDTVAWHDYAMRAAEVRLCAGRIRFVQSGVPKRSPPFGSAVIIFRRHGASPPRFSSFYHTSAPPLPLPPAGAQSGPELEGVLDGSSNADYEISSDGAYAYLPEE